MKTMLVIAGGAILGNYVAEKFVLKPLDGSPGGFVEVQMGLGMDDLARAACITAAIMLLKKFSG